MPEHDEGPPASRVDRGDRWQRLVGVIALIAVLAISMAVRIAKAERAPSYDEIWNLAMTAGRGTPFDAFEPDRFYAAARSQITLADAASTGSIWTHMIDRHPPLYPLTLRCWRWAFGESSAVAQAYTFAWSCVFVCFAFATARATMGIAVATLLGLTLAFAPTQVYLAQEIRDYEMMVALGALALWIMTRVERLGASRASAIALGLFPLPLLLTHYFSIGGAVAIGLFGCWRLVGHRRAFLIALMTSAVVYAVAWIPFALVQIKEVQDDAFVHIAERNLLVELMLAATAPFRLLVDRTIVEVPLSAVAGALFVLPWFLARRFAPLRPWALWLACSVLPLVVLDEIRSTIHLGFARYASIATPAILPLAVGCVYAIRRSLAVPFAAGLALFAGYELHAGAWIASECAPLGVTTSFVARAAKPGEGVFVFNGRAGPSFGRLMMLQCGGEPGLFPRPAMVITRPVPADVARGLPPRAWLISPASDGPVDGLIPSARVLWSRDVDRIARVSYLDLANAASPATSAAPADTMRR